MTTDAGAGWLVFVALAAVVPLAVVLLVAIVRGYTITLHMHRPRPTRKDDP